MTLKYRNIPTEIDGIRFDSEREGRRYGELKLLERAGRISELRVHPAFPLDVNGYPICRYEADFSYERGGVRITEDVKGVETEAFKIKRKLMRAIHGIDIEIVR